MKAPPGAPDGAGAPAAPAFAVTTRLVARSLGVTPAELSAGLREARESDLPRVLSFRKAHVGATAARDDERYLRWRYRLGRQVLSLGELWLLELGGKLIGLIGTEHVLLRAGDTRLAAERPMDLQTTAGSRESGLGVWMNQAAAARAAAVLAIGGNRHSQGIVRRLFTPLAPLRTYTYVIDSRPFLHKAGLRGPVGAAMAALGNGALRLRGAWFRWRRRFVAHLDVRPIERFDAADALADARPDAEALGFERSAAALNHRLFDNPRARYFMLGAYAGSERRGVVAWRVEPGLGGTPQVRIVDYWIVAREGAERAAALDALMTRVFAAARRAHCHAVRLATADRRLAASLMRLGFASPGEAGEGMPMGLLVSGGDSKLSRALAARPCAITALLDDDDGTYGSAVVA